MENYREDALDRIMMVLVKADVPDLQICRSKIAQILGDYDMDKKEKSLTVYTEGKNEYFLKKFILSKAVAGCSKNTLSQYSREIIRALSEIGKDADTVTSDDVQFLLVKIIQRASKSYADNVRRDLSSFYAFLMREELITRNPMLKVERIKLQKKQKLAFTEYEVEKIRNACQNWREKAIVEILLSTGCRVSEINGMRLEDIDGGAQLKISILGKGDKYRTVYLTARADITVREYLAERKDTNPYLFPKSAVVLGEKGKNADRLRQLKADWYKDPDLVAPDGNADKSVIESAIRNIGKRAGVENCHPHRFRRTCATFALRRGMPIEQVSKMLGHAEIGTTQIYLDLSEEELAQAHRKYVV